MSDFPTTRLGPKPTVIDMQTAREALAGGPAPGITPRLQYAYDRANDLLTVEGVTYAGEVFRQLGALAPLDTPLKIMSRGDGVITLVLMEPTDPGWHTPKDECGRINVGWNFGDRAVGVYIEEDARPERVVECLRRLIQVIEGQMAPKVEPQG